MTDTTTVARICINLHTCNDTWLIDTCYRSLLALIDLLLRRMSVNGVSTVTTNGNGLYGNGLGVGLGVYWSPYGRHRGIGQIHTGMIHTIPSLIHAIPSDQLVVRAMIAADWRSLRGIQGPQGGAG